jgi:hypothetical protein
METPRPKFKYKLVPYKILVMLMYGQGDWIQRLPNGQILAQTGPMSRKCTVTNRRLHGYLRTLAESGYLTSYSYPTRGQILVTLLEVPHG